MHLSLPGRGHRRLCAPAIALLAGVAGTAAAVAGNVTINVRDATGAPLDAAVVALYGESVAAANAPADRVHVMDQIDKQFAPRVLAIRPGDRISFPNSDDIRHHVYSFSPAKTFELPLYHGLSTEPIAFDVSGTVAVGCNIHDRMSAHIYVVDAPRFAVTESGGANFAALPYGRYEYVVHHHSLAHGTTERTPLIIDDGATVVNVTVDVKPPPMNDPAGLSPLEQKFQALRRAQ
jgi:plastocyanin